MGLPPVDVVEGSGRRGFAAYPGDPQLPSEHLRAARSGRTAVAFAGFLLNREELEAGLPGPPPDDEADLILRLLMHGGTAALARLRGGFALLCWDGDRDTLTATHDPIGTHPLFWAEANGGILFSDSVETLLEQPGVSRDLNRLALADHIRWRWPEPQETFFAGIRRVPPGNTLTDTSGARNVRRTWDPAPLPVSWASADEVAQFDELFAIAVDRCFELGRVGISLSGGLDSVTVAAFAAEAAERRGVDAPIALSMLFPDAGVNEEEIQRSVASQLGFKMVMMGLDEAVAPLNVLEATLELAKSWPAPMYNPWLPAYLALGHVGRQHGADSFVTGGGGDEWLCVSPYLAADLMASLDVLGLYRLVAGARRSHRMSTAMILKCYLWTFGVRALGRRALGSVPALLERRDRRVLQRTTQSWLAPDPELRRAIDDRFTPAGAPRNYYQRELREGLDASLIAQELEEFFELGRRVGLPVLRPFLDPDVIGLLARVPPEVLNHGGRTKALVRQTLDGRFPELAFGQQRKVQAIPTLERVLRTQFAELWASVGPPRALADLGVVDLPKLETAAADAYSHPYRSLWRLFMLESLEVFARARL
ncbi:MAG: asparagine synthase-related protein [Acidimicrobiales bacterium]